VPEFSGVAATFGAAPVQTDNGAALLNMAEKFLAVKQAKQQQAMAQVESAVKLANMGFPVDDKAFAKFVKQAKLPIDLNPDSLSAQVKVAKGQVKSPTQTDEQPPAAKGGAPLATSTPQIQPLGGNNPKEKAQSWIKQISDRAVKLANMNAQTDEAKAQNALKVETLKTQALGGDEQAAGKLIAMNQWEKAFSLDYAQWTSMSPEQKAKTLNIQAGMESDADKLKRGERIGESLLTSGKYTDPSDAMQVGNILASGGTVPPALQAKQKPFTFGELSEQADMMGKLVQLGVPANKVGQVAHAAAMGGLENALPTGLKPIALQSLQLEQTRTEIEVARYQKEVEIAKRAGAAEARKELTAEAQADLNSFKALVELKKAGGQISDDLLKGAQIKAAKALNMNVEETKTLWNYLTGGTSLKFTPALTPEGKSTVDRLSGKGNKTPEPSMFQKTVDALTGKKKDPKDVI
jgi:hypothetical protein